MDLRDPITKKKLTPKEPRATLSRAVFLDYLQEVQQGKEGKGELVSWLRAWCQIPARKTHVWGYLDSYMVAKMLAVSFFEIGGYTQLVNELYCQRKKFVSAKNPGVFNVEDFFNTLLMCNLQRNHILQFNDVEISKKKLANAWRRVSERENKTGLANLLLDTLGKQMGYDCREVVKGLDMQTGELDLPLWEQDKGISKEQYLQKNDLVYLLSRTILQFNEAEASNVDSPVVKFVDQYKQLSEELGKADLYDQYQDSMTQLWKKDEKKLAADEPVVEDAA